MSYGSYDGRQPGTTEAREAARERAREIRDQQRKQERRGRTIRNGSIIVGTLAVVAIVAFVLTNFAHAPGRGPLNMMSDGIKIGEDLTAVRTSGIAPDTEPVASTKNPDNVVDIRIYVDYLCPNCGTFQQKNGDQLETLLEGGRRHRRDPPDRAADDEVGRRPVLAACGERRGLRGGVLARQLLQVPRHALRRPAQGGRDRVRRRGADRPRPARRRDEHREDRRLRRRSSDSRTG